MQTPLDRLCQRCYDQLQWRIDFRKYKPLEKPRKCNMCSQPHVLKAYRTICDPCSGKDGKKLCTKCAADVKTLRNAEGQAKYAVPQNETKKDEERYEREVDEIQEKLEGLKLRERKTIERKIKTGEVVYRNGKFVNAENED